MKADIRSEFHSLQPITMSYVLQEASVYSCAHPGMGFPERPSCLLNMTQAFYAEMDFLSLP